MAGVWNRTQRRLERVDTVQLLERAADSLTNEIAAITGPDPLVQLSNKRIIETYVQPHRHTIAH